MNEQELLYTMALTMALRQQPKHQRTLFDTLGSGTAVYENRRELGQRFEHFSQRLAESVAMMDCVLPQCEQELADINKHHIQVLMLGDERYPRRLMTCEDAPLLLYTLGNADLNALHIVSVVGTRRCTEHGRDICRELTNGLAQAVPDTLVVSGLAYGIDISVHRAALNAGLPTVGVLAHGLDEIYPRAHRQTAIEMIGQGGLLTEFTTHTPMNRLNFLQRNRIVAGMADAVIVVESPARGGSLNTARLAADYHRDVFAFPGRPSDPASEGCNLLIRHNSAVLINSYSDLLTDLGWHRTTACDDDCQPTLFPRLTAEEQAVVDALSGTDTDLSLTELSALLDIPTYKLTPLTLALEMKGVVKAMPGSRCHLIGH